MQGKQILSQNFRRTFAPNWPIVPVEEFASSAAPSGDRFGRE
jgi:hypothetical protein